MSWAFVLTLSATAYAFKVLGLVVVGDRRLPAVVDRCLALIPAALVAAIVFLATALPALRVSRTDPAGVLRPE